MAKTAELVRVMERRGLSVPVEIDGGVNERTCEALARAGATVLVSGSHLFGASDYPRAVGRLRRLAEAARAGPSK